MKIIEKLMVEYNTFFGKLLSHYIRIQKGKSSAKYIIAKDDIVHEANATGRVSQKWRGNDGRSDE